VGPGQTFLPRVGSGHFFVARVSHLLVSKKISNFSIFFPSGQKISSGLVKNTWVKNGLASYLLWVESMLG